MEQVYSSLTQRAVHVHQKLVRNSGQHRILIAVSGSPGSGKSTIASQVVQRINSILQRPVAICIAMDGFHYTREYLDTLPNRVEAHACRGAEWTFDANGVVALVQMLSISKKTSEPSTIFAPSFDHKLKDPIPNAIRIEPEVEIVIIEGNWLLLDSDPWKQIQENVDDTWFVDVDEELASRRIARRHLTAGTEATMEAAIGRARSNDLQHGTIVRRHSLKPNIWVESVEVNEGK
ncbi:P-loop containing nucleoside triphosphate hydrolase protein [Xylaria bambusicola]|uniref:P-loop containing nucleoside triphosphate hydrolase protein n=1 Tax=Xylaria bambusicola TaxID=326684 RepID=UPI0020073888|nr:P-loop containing nucleoside triphosphate hydrolase protein [Xylaria bambusicola]KAI0521280.1 P-loop containing nucleoside triphosphate hydrolase protein [Xylaria bambusicola]